MSVDVLPALCISIPLEQLLAITLQPLQFHLSTVLVSLIILSLNFLSRSLSLSHSLSLPSRPNCWASVSRSAPVTQERQPLEVRLQRWYLPEHSAHHGCHDNRAHALRKMNYWQPNRKRRDVGEREENIILNMKGFKHRWNL